LLLNILKDDFVKMWKSNLIFFKTNRTSTFISGVLAVGIYLFLLLALIIYFNTREETKPIHYVKKNENAIRVTMASPPSQEVTPETKKEIKTPQTKTRDSVKKQKDTKKKIRKEEVVKKKPNKKPKKKKDKKPPPKKINKRKDLFKNLPTSKKAKKKTEKPEKSKKKTIKQKEKKSTAMDMLNNNSIKVQKKSDRGVVNAYFAKIEEKLNGWTAQSEYAGASVEIWIEIESNGRFKFRIKKYSSNEMFNEGINNYLKRLKIRGLDKHTRKKPYSFNITIVAEN